MQVFQHFLSNRPRLLSILIGLAFLLSIAPSGLGDPRPVQYSPQSCLWSIHSPDSTLYLLGSLHLLSRNAYPLATAIEKAYADSQKVVFETDIAGMNDPTIQAKMLELGLYPQGESLYQNLDDNTRRLLNKTMAGLDLPAAQFSPFKPWFVALTLTILELQRLGFNPNYGIDVYFYNRAQEDGKDIGFLEPPEYQVNLLGSMNAHDQNLFLSQTLTDLEFVADLSGDMVRYWKTGDVDNLYALLFKSFNDYPTIHDRLLLQRNRTWAEKVEQLMRQNKHILFIVGVGHLIGPGSLVDLLEKRGYTLKQM